MLWHRPTTKQVSTKHSNAVRIQDYKAIRQKSSYVVIVNCYQFAPEGSCLAWVAGAWKYHARKNRTREGDTRGEREQLLERPMN